MVDEQPLDSQLSQTVAVAEASANGTGVHVETTPEATDALDAPSALAEAAAEPIEATAAAESTEATTAEPVAAVHAAEPVDVAEPTEATAASVTAEAELPTAESPAATAADAPDESGDFLTRLVAAMRATAAEERARVGGDVDRQREAQLARLAARREADVQRMRDLASDDRRTIDSWAETEHRRVESERGRRTTELETDLRNSLADHDRQIGAEIEALETAIAAHRAQLDAFFGSLETETDPVRIAQLATARPTFPDLASADAGSTTPAPAGASTAVPAQPAEVAATAAPDDEPAAVPVMDPIARLGLLDPATAPVEETPVETPAAVPAGAFIRSSIEPSLDPTSRPTVVSPYASVTSGRRDDGVSRTADSGPTSGVIGWLRRMNDPGDR